MSLSEDPFNPSLDQVMKFREFDIGIVRGNPSPLESDAEFVSTYKAVQKVNPQNPVVIPRRASFFDFSSVSPFEKQFKFAQDEHYMEIRNFIVAIYRLFSNRYLPYTLCRRNIKAPAHLTLQIWKFLQKYGLINYKIDEETRPCSLIPTSDRWPQLIYTINDKLLTNDQYNRKIHPTIQNIMPPSDTCLFMKSPFYPNDKKRPSSEIPGLMMFGNWSKQELESLIEALKPVQTNMQEGANYTNIPHDAWIQISQKVKTKTPEECAQMVAMMPLSIGQIEANLNQIKNVDGSQHSEYKNSNEIIKDMALSHNHNLKLVYRAVHGVGNENAQNIIRHKMVDLPNNAVEAASILAMDKITKNAEKVKQMHKARILQCLQKTISILQQDIQAKKLLIEEARADQLATKSSETESISDDVE